MKPVRVLAAAHRDIQTEKTYYNKAQTGLGRRFSRSVAAALRQISDNPEAMQIVECGICRWPVENFPHGLLYSIEESEIVVVSVFHPRQHPSKWRRRI